MRSCAELRPFLPASCWQRRFPLILDLAADGIPVAVICRVLGFFKQAFY